MHAQVFMQSQNLSLKPTKHLEGRDAGVNPAHSAGGAMGAVQGHLGAKISLHGYLGCVCPRAHTWVSLWLISKPS